MKIEERDMLHDKVCTILRKAILKGEFKEGEKLVQNNLAEMIGVSRMPIREALRTLEIEGLVKIEPHKGAVVKTVSSKDIEEIYELRAVLEPMALKHSITNYTQRDLQNLKKHHQKMIESSIDTYSEINRKFHKLLLCHCKNSRLMTFIDTISYGFTQDTPEIIPGQIEKSIEEHSKLLKAISKNDTTNAMYYLEMHIKRSGEDLIRSMISNKST